MKHKEVPIAKRGFLGKHQTFQRETLKVYRDQGIIPSITTIANESGTSFSTANQFVQGSGKNALIRAYLRRRLMANFKVLPEDLVKLFAIWDET